MAETLDPFRYIGYLRSRWRFIAASCAVAVALAFGVSLAMPRQYTATARIVIDPPAGTDLRAAVAVSPIYLESLRTYEQFASGDSLFQKAVEKFGLRSGSIEAQKRRELKVALVRNTRILEISATLTDPRKAQALAQFIAQSTVEMNRSLALEGDQDLAHGMQQQQQEFRQRLDQLDAAGAELAAHEPVDALKAENQTAATLRASIQTQISNTQLEIADAAEREKTVNASETAEVRRQLANARARLEQLQRQLETFSRQAVDREKLLATRTAHRDRIEADRKAVQTQLTATETQLRDARAGAAFRGERLKVIDPGIVPERPSSPNVMLNVAAAFLLGLVLPILWLTLSFGSAPSRADAAYPAALPENRTHVAGRLPYNE
jgi:uncharacterized protein involved in exopolysaccharide biosynthesis